MVNKFIAVKKALAVLTSAALVFSFMPLAAGAAEADMTAEAASVEAAAPHEIEETAAEEVEYVIAQDPLAVAQNAPLILVDAGHGWVLQDSTGKYVPDSGNVGIGGVQEADLVMEVTPMLVRELLGRGYRVVTTRPVIDEVQSYMTPPQVSVLGRVELSNKVVHPDIFVSVHFNSAPADARGSLVLFDSKQLESIAGKPLRDQYMVQVGSDRSLAGTVQPQSAKLARAIRDRFYAVSEFDMQGNRASGVQDQNTNGAVFSYNNSPAVTLELGFLSNSHDAAYCQDGAKQQRMAKAAADGIDDYFGGSPSGGGISVGGLSLGEKGATTSKTKFLMNAKNVVGGSSAVSGVSFIVKNNSTGASYAYKGTNHSANDWKATFNVANFSYKQGDYTITVEAKNADGQVNNSVSKSITLVKDGTKPVAGTQSHTSPSPSGFKATASDITAQNGVRSVLFKLWRAGDKTVFEKFTAKKNGDGSFSADIKLDKFKNSAGTYYLQQIVYDTWNNSAVGSAQRLTVTDNTDTTRPTMGELVFSAGSQTAETKFTMTAKNVKDPSGVKEVKFRVANLDDAGVKAKTLPAKSSGEDWSAEFDLAEFGGYYGRYKVNVYATDNAGNTGVIENGEFTVISATTQTPIMGEPQAQVVQLVNYFLSGGRPYPSYYTEAGRDTDLAQLAQMYYDVAVAEGVRPEVAWAQMCLETGFLQFGRDVKIGQFNFAGLGTTGGGVAGFDFAATYGDNAEGIRHGVIGHVQHLKLYASKAEPVFTVDGKPIDPRWDAAISAGRRGSAPFVENLENNWAMSPGYSKSLLNGLNAILGMSAVMQVEIPHEVEALPVEVAPEETVAPDEPAPDGNAPEGQAPPDSGEAMPAPDDAKTPPVDEAA